MSSRINITAKSKTFLVGEYGITCGGSAIILLTRPKFVLSAEASDDNRSNSDSNLNSVSAAKISRINPNSPAFEFYKRHSDAFKNLSIDFFDPHRHSGGFGASSAQFVTLYKLYKRINNEKVNFSELLSEYRKIIDFKSDHSSVKPSGADCVAQFLNEHTYFDSSSNYVEKMTWNFSDIDFLIIKTQNKLATHSHLQNISKDFIEANAPELKKITDSVKTAWINNDSASFVKGIQDFSDKLGEMELVCEETQKLLSKILQIDGVLAAKGCGAMGMDTIVAIVNRNLIKKIEKKLEKDIANKNIFKEH